MKQLILAAAAAWCVDGGTGKDWKRETESHWFSDVINLTGKKKNSLEKEIYFYDAAVK